MNKDHSYYGRARAVGCPRELMLNMRRARIVLQPTQLAASAAARSCDLTTGPREIGYGGARGGGKSHWLLAQMGADDCQRFPGLKCLLIRKVGKANVEHFEDLRPKLFGHLPHEYSSSRALLTFANGSRIVMGHYQHESDIQGYIGNEYDVIGIEEATTLTARKYTDIFGSCRSSKSGWRPRLYSTTNPGGIGHAWYRKRFVLPHRERNERDTRFLPALVTDNHFINPEYRKDLERQNGWKKRAWRYGDWEISAGQFFCTFRRDTHVISKFDEGRAVEWFAAMDYGFTHHTVVLLGCLDGDGNMFVVDEHAERKWTAQRHAPAIKVMLDRHNLCLSNDAEIAAKRARDEQWGRRAANPLPCVYPPGYVHRRLKLLGRFVAGSDVFSTQDDGTTIALRYRQQGITLQHANMDRVNGWAEILHRLGDPDSNVAPSLFIHERCARLAECLPSLVHDPNRPEDVLKENSDEDSPGTDDFADALRYLVATRPRLIHQVKLHGF